MLTKEKFQLKESVQFITGQQVLTSNPDKTTTIYPFSIKVNQTTLSCQSTFGNYIMKMLDLI